MTVTAGFDGVCGLQVVGHDAGSSTQNAVDVRHDRRRLVVTAVQVTVLEVAVDCDDDSNSRSAGCNATHTVRRLKTTPLLQGGPKNTLRCSEIRTRHQGGAQGGRAPEKIVMAPAKITGLIMFHLRVTFIHRYSDFSFHINNKCVSSFMVRFQ